MVKFYLFVTIFFTKGKYFEKHPIIKKLCKLPDVNNKNLCANNPKKLSVKIIFYLQKLYVQFFLRPLFVHLIQVIT